MNKWMWISFYLCVGSGVHGDFKKIHSGTGNYVIFIQYQHLITIKLYTLHCIIY